MNGSRDWARRVRPVGGVVMLLLVAQYFLGLWTNVYAPARFAPYDVATNYSPALRVHIVLGDVLFLLALVALVLAGLARRWSLVAPAVVLVAAILGAGEFGLAFVNSAPNDPIDSFGMGALFLVAFLAGAALLMLATRTRDGERPTAGPSPTGG